MELSFKTRALIVVVASLAIIIGTVFYSTTGVYNEKLYNEEISILKESFESYKGDPTLYNLQMEGDTIPVKEGKRIVAIIGQSLPERVAIEYYDGTIKMRESSEDPWGSKYEMKPITKDNQLRGFEIVSDNINIQIVE